MPTPNQAGNFHKWPNGQRCNNAAIAKPRRGSEIQLRGSSRHLYATVKKAKACTTIPHAGSVHLQSGPCNSLQLKKQRPGGTSRESSGRTAWSGCGGASTAGCITCEARIESLVAACLHKLYILPFAPGGQVARGPLRRSAKGKLQGEPKSLHRPKDPKDEDRAETAMSGRALREEKQTAQTSSSSSSCSEPGCRESLT